MPIPKKYPYIFAVLGALGLADASYLAANHYLGTPLVCSILTGCEKVTASPYALVFGVPVALLGMIYYVFIFLGTFLYLDKEKNWIFRFLSWLTLTGFLASLWFTYLQLFVIKSLCLYCLISAAISAILFVTGVIFLFREEET